MSVVQMIGIMFATTLIAFVGGYVGVAFSSDRQTSSHSRRKRDFAELTRRILAVLGILIVVVGLGADPLGLSDSPGIGFFQRQTILLGVAILGIASMINVQAQTADKDVDKN